MFAKQKLLEDSTNQLFLLKQEVEKLSHDPQKNSERLLAIKEELSTKAKELWTAYETCFFIKIKDRLYQTWITFDTLGYEVSRYFNPELPGIKIIPLIKGEKINEY
jgi:hypothetical protein